MGCLFYICKKVDCVITATHCNSIPFRKMNNLTILVFGKPRRDSAFQAMPLSTDPFQFRWLKACIYSSCYYHHQIGSVNLTNFYHIVVVCLRCLLHHILSLIAYTFRENWNFVFIIIVQFMMSSNRRMRFGLQIVFVCLYITSSHYHHCAKLSDNIVLIKCLSDKFCRLCVSEIKHILWVIHFTIYGDVCFQFTHLSCDDGVRILICIYVTVTSSLKYTLWGLIHLKLMVVNYLFTKISKIYKKLQKFFYAPISYGFVDTLMSKKAAVILLKSCVFIWHILILNKFYWVQHWGKN